MRGGPVAIPASGLSSVGNGDIPKSKADRQVDSTLDLHGAVRHVAVVSQALKVARESIESSTNYHSPSKQRVCDLIRASEAAHSVVQNIIKVGANTLAPIPSMQYASKRLLIDDRQIKEMMRQPKRQKRLDDNTKALQEIIVGGRHADRRVSRYQILKPSDINVERERATRAATSGSQVYDFFTEPYQRSPVLTG
jgi:hypothetical protein